MRVLMQNRADSSLYPGGDTTQMHKTREYLQRLGAQVDISFDYRPDLKGYDAVHLFNTISMAVADTYLQCLNAKSKGIPIALSTIYYHCGEYESFLGGISPRPLRFIYRHEKLKYTLMGLRDKVCHGRIEERVRLCRRFGLKRLQQEVFRLADMLLPSSQIEYGYISRDFAPGKRCTIVPCAVEGFFKGASPEWFRKNYKVPEKFVLCAGMISPLKNQLSLIRALKNTDITLVFAGAMDTRDFIYKRYARQCVREGKGRAIFIGRLKQEELASAYAAAAVHVQPSWLETVGLVSLEAALAGCRIVITDRGGGRDYFHDLAWYCNPADLSSIREAVLAAYHSSGSRVPGLRERILNDFTWGKAAEKTLEAYAMLKQ